MPHSDPDPDAIASSLALRYLLATKLEIKAEIVYEGIVGRAENKALVRYLGYPLRHVCCADLDGSVPIALVDTQPGAGNNVLPRHVAPKIVVDHHTWRQDTTGSAFFDIRTDVGATSTVFTEYLQVAGIELPSPLATALFYGIKTDTMGLSRSTHRADVAAYFYLQPQVDIEALGKIERTQVPAAYFQSFVATLQAASIYNNVLISYLGEISYPDLTAEMADLLLRLEGIEWVICGGVYDKELVLSIRKLVGKIGAEQVVQAIVGERGSAGGHGSMAAGQIQLQHEDPEQLFTELAQRALDYLGVPPQTVGRPLVK